MDLRARRAIRPVRCVDWLADPIDRCTKPTGRLVAGPSDARLRKMGRLPLVLVASLVLLQAACCVQAFLLPSPVSSKGITPRHVKLGSPSSFLRPLMTRRRARDFDDEEQEDDTLRGPPPRRRRPPMRRSDDDEDEEEDGDEGSLYSIRGGAGGGRGGGRRGGGGGGRGTDEDEAWSMRPGALDRPRPQPVRRPGMSGSLGLRFDSIRLGIASLCELVDQPLLLSYHAFVHPSIQRCARIGCPSASPGSRRG